MRAQRTQSHDRTDLIYFELGASGRRVHRVLRPTSLRQPVHPQCSRSPADVKNERRRFVMAFELQRVDAARRPSRACAVQLAAHRHGTSLGILLN